MRNKGYYSIRTGKNKDGVRLDLAKIKILFMTIFNKFNVDDYFQEAFGYECVDAGEVPGSLGHSISAALLLAIRKENLWPIWDKINEYSEDDLFDMIEFLFDHVSKPIDGHYHNYSNCGYHYNTFNSHEGRVAFRDAINPLLRDYDLGYELSESGEILQLPEEGLEPLLSATLPGIDSTNIESRVEAAVIRFRKYRSSLEDRRYAILELASVLEFIRPRLSTVISSKDESDLFNIANNFGLRHHTEKQKTDYDQSIWYSWLFYYYLATIHACVRLLQKNAQPVKP